MNCLLSSQMLHENLLKPIHLIATHWANRIRHVKNCLTTKLTSNSMATRLKCKDIILRLKANYTIHSCGKQYCFQNYCTVLHEYLFEFVNHFSTDWTLVIISSNNSNTAIFTSNGMKTW